MSATLEEIAEVALGKMLDKTKHRSGVSLPYLRNQNVRWASFDLEDLASMYFEQGELDRYSVAKGDVIVCEGGEPGRAAVWDGRVGSMRYQKALHRVRPAPGVSPYWLVYALLHDVSRGRLNHLFSGSTIRHLPRQAFLGWHVLLPPTDEQVRIVEVLDSFTTRLDAAVNGLERVEANLKRYRASVLKAAVEGRLVPTEAELAKKENRHYEPASVLLARILEERRRRWEESELAKMKAKGEAPKNDKWKAKYEEPTLPEFGRQPSLPDGWCWATVEQVAAHEPYSLAIGPFGSSLKVSDYRPSGVPLVFVRNIRAENFSASNYVSSEKAHELRAHRVDAGDLLITKMGDPPGDCAIYPRGEPGAIITADCIKLRPHPALRESDYLMWALRSEQVQRSILQITKGVAQKKVSLERFRTIVVPLAPLAEQGRIVQEVSRLMGAGAHLHADLEIAEARITRLRQSILKWAFEGKLVDQDPSDEPASVLLERIKADRAAAQPAPKPRPRAPRRSKAKAA